MIRIFRATTMLIATALFALSAKPAAATSVQDFVRIKGHERNLLTGMGIVIGLDGTGDESNDSLAAARPYARLLTNLGNPVNDPLELAQASAYAIVSVTMEIPPEGVREGDRLDIAVDTLFNAESLEGGRLVFSPLRLPGPDSPDAEIFAFAEGPIVLDGEDRTSGIVRGGGQMLHDVRTQVVTASGSMWLVLKPQYARYPVAVTIADAINDWFTLDGYAGIAVVEDAKNIRIQVPRADRDAPAAFISNMLTIAIDPSFIATEARIVINEREGVISVTANVAIGPVGITHRGLQLANITAAEPTPSAGGGFVSIDTTDGTTRQSTYLVDLLGALDQLKVPVEDQITIIYELQKTGALHAEIVHE